ncbi:MAG TPA: phosphonate ABC transporter ATP-binding protein [Burkholderiales bacterium]|nr:phosphonate ABC transporter ATP-binding protein [Burkholderiales bacterium]
MATAIAVSELSRRFGAYQALDRIDLRVESGEMVALIGASGSGKSTLLRHLAGLMTGDDVNGTSTVHVLGRKVQEGGRLSRDIRDIRAHIGFVFQRFNLVERLPLITNVMAGMLYRVPAWRSAFKMFTREEVQMGMEALGRVGMADRALQRASTLSGGQQQRAAIARTLVQKAGVILADEPIASLDPKSSRKVMDALAKINREDGTTVLVSLHQVDVALRYCPRTVALHHGRIVYDGPSANLTPKLLHELYGAEADDVLLTSDSANLEFVHRPRSTVVTPEMHAITEPMQAAAESRA